MSWRPGYAVAAAALLAIEVFIAIAVHDRFVRPYLGDSIAVILVYLSLRAVTRLGVLPAAATTFAIAVLIEFGQRVGITHILGIHGSVIARTVLGTGYDPHDFVAYAGGALAVLAVERWRRTAASAQRNPGKHPLQRRNFRATLRPRPGATAGRIATGGAAPTRVSAP